MNKFGPDKAGLLYGIRILELADEKASFCTRVLADLGALVIKVEKPGGDNSRRAESSSENEPTQEPNLSHLYNNANKLSITLDIEKEEGRSLFLRLVRKTDVVVETFSPGYLADIGCPYEVMSGVNPRLILASVTGFGQTGPRSSYKSCDLVTSAYGGQMFVTGVPGAPPLRPYGEQSGYVSSLFAAVGILLALFRKRRTGQGEHLDISSQEAVAGTLEHVLVHYLYNGLIPKRQGTLSGNRSSFILPCKDGHIHISILAQWETLVEWMAAEGMAQDLTEEKWKDEDYRNQNIDHIMDVLQRWTLTHNVGELFETAQVLRFPWAPVCRPEDVVTSPQLLAREFLCAMDHPAEPGGSFLIPGMPYRFDGSSSYQVRPAPTLGKDNKQVYCGELGLSEPEVVRLARLGII